MHYNKEIVGKICGKICGIATSKRVHIGSLLNLWANSETVFANDDRKVSANDTIQSIEAWFDYMNEEFEKLYEIYT